MEINYIEMNGFSLEVQSLVKSAMESYEKGDYKSAVVDFQEASLLEPKAKSLINHLSACYAKLGEFEKAYNAMKPVFKTEIDLKKVYFENMSDYCVRLKKYKEADSHLLKGVKRYNELSIYFKLFELNTHLDYYSKESAMKILVDKIAPMVSKETEIKDLFQAATCSGSLEQNELVNKYLVYINERANESNIKTIITMYYETVNRWIEDWKYDLAIKYLKNIKGLSKKHLTGDEANEMLDFTNKMGASCLELKKFYDYDDMALFVTDYIGGKIRLSIQEKVGGDIELRNIIVDDLEDTIDIINVLLKSEDSEIKDSLEVVRKESKIAYPQNKEEIDRLCDEVYKENKNKGKACMLPIILVGVGTVLAGTLGGIVGMMTN
ncbi:MAG: tetratricopeptide repeat protein [Sarcina sp.]